MAKKNYLLPPTKKCKVEADVDPLKLSSECRKCMRLKSHGGSCGGRQGLNLCLAFKSI